MKKSKRLEDYLKSIYLISTNNEERISRVKDIAKLMNVKTATVVYALKRLNEMGMINQKPYGYVTLTEKGLKESKKIIEKFNVLFEFYNNVLNVSKETAFQDACKAEHIISEETFEKMSQYLKRGK
jgi:DtxR family Mn-dependent transcriptional regulator